MATTLEATGNLAVQQVAPAVGAEVGDIDLSQPINERTAALLRDAWHEHIALVFHGQDITEEEQLRFAACFGEVGMRRRRPGEQGEGEFRGSIMMVTNITDGPEDQRNSFGDGEMWWHHDTCYYDVPNKATLIYSVELPATGGNTRVNNMYLAYDNIPQPLKDKLEGGRVLQVHDYKRRERIDLETADIDNMIHCYQPIFVTHPVTGKRALYVNRLMTAAIEGLPRVESDAVLEDLFAITEDPAIYYEHEWKLGDLLMWDNRCSIHMRTDFPRDQRRLLRRCTVAGEALEA